MKYVYLLIIIFIIVWFSPLVYLYYQNYQINLKTDNILNNIDKAKQNHDRIIQQLNHIKEYLNNATL